MACDLFLKRMAMLGSPSESIIQDSNIIADVEFANSNDYHSGMLYDQDGNSLERVDFKFQVHNGYSIATGNQVDYLIQFRPNFFPELKYPYKTAKSKDPNASWERLGFYIDVVNKTRNTTDKYLIIGKNDKNNLIRYYALKCNWYFQWYDQKGNYHKVLGVLRKNSLADKANSNMVVSTVDGKVSCYLPSNKATQTLLYNTRLIISTDSITPKVYEVSNILETFPLGVMQIALSQTVSTDKDDFESGIADNGTPRNEEPTPISRNYTASLTCPTNQLQYKGVTIPITYTVTCNDEPVADVPIWHFYLAEDFEGTKEECTEEELAEYLNIEHKDNTLLLSYPKSKSSDLTGYVLTVMITDAEQHYSASIQIKVRR